MTNKANAESPSTDIIHSLSVSRMARLLEKSGFIPQILHADDGRPAIRFMKLGIAGMVLFFGNSEADPERFRVVVLNAYVDGLMPVDKINAISAKGVLPKIYQQEKTTVIELCIPVEAGFPEAAITYYVTAFETFLKALETMPQ